MKVLFLTEVGDPRVGSSTRQMYQQARRLGELGHEAVVVCAVRDASDATPTEIMGTRVYRLHSDYPVRWRAWRCLHNRVIDGPLDRILAEERPDVVHAHLLHTHLGYHSLTQAKRAGAVVVFTAHDVMTFCYQKLTCFHGGEAQQGQGWDVTARLAKCIPCQRARFRPGRNRAILRVLERDVDRLTVVSDALGDVLRANRVPVHATVHNAIELQARPTPEAVAAFREGLGLTGKLVLAIGGRLHSQKGVGKLLEMLAQLAPRFPDVRLIVMGKREIYDDEFRAQAQALGVDSLVVPTGWLDGDELRQAYAATDVFVTPSICFDTFGLVNLEAMEQARPVVATVFGGSQEVVEHGVSGFIANPFDVETFAGHIADLLGDADLRTKMGQAGRQRVERRFTIERLTDEFLELYRSALGGTPPATPAR
jgi:glycosyltransferase involved in cell wall biosynthesis